MFTRNRLFISAVLCVFVYSNFPVLHFDLCPPVCEDGPKNRKARINKQQSSAKFYKVQRKSQMRRRCQASGGGSHSCLWMPEGVRGGW